MEHLARILNDLHRAFGTITDVSVLARLRTYDEIGIGPIVTAADRDALMLAVKQKQWVTAGGQKVSLKADGRAVLAFVNAYRDRYNALYSDMVKREEEQIHEILCGMIAAKIIREGEDAAKQMLIDMSSPDIVFSFEERELWPKDGQPTTMHINGIKADLPWWAVRDISRQEDDPEVDAKENRRLVEAFKYTRANLVQVLAQRFREYDGEKKLVDHIREHYKPLGPEQSKTINEAYKLSRSKK